MLSIVRPVEAPQRVIDPRTALAWLTDSTGTGEITGFDHQEWEAGCWVLNTMWHNPASDGIGTHDEVHRAGLASGEVDPLVVGAVNLDEVGVLTGGGLGYAWWPGPGWERLLWADNPNCAPHPKYPPCYQWFTGRSFPASIEPPTEGSMDSDSWDGLLSVLAAHSPEGTDTECIAFFAQAPSVDYESLDVWRSPLGRLKQLFDHDAAPHGVSPSNFWPVDRSWYVWTDWDLMGTRVSGSASLIEQVKRAPLLEAIEWQPQPE